MTEQQPTPSQPTEGQAPTWFTPGGTMTTTRTEEGQPTAPLPAATPGQPLQHPTEPFAPRPPLAGAGGPVGPSGPAAPQRGGSGRRRIAELSAVALLAAVLSAGGAVAAVRLTDDAPAPAAVQSSVQSDRGTEATPVVQADPSAPDWTATADAVSPSVVAITATSSQGGGQGSGVVIDDQGNVLTNNHVVAGAQDLRVTLSDGRTYEATIRGTDPSTDLAVISITNGPSDLAPVAMGDSDALAVGEPVMAVGNPLGLAGTVTTGIVSALNRPVTTQGEGQSTPGGSAQQSEPVVTNAIQTSAAINPGNSGGALVDSAGRLVGINSSIASLGPSGQSGNIGIGFAIPANEARSIADQLIQSGTATHAYLGVTPQDGSASDGTATRAGAEVTSVGDGTPAADAGLRSGDVVVAVDNEPVDSAASLVAHIRERAVGDEVTLTVLRDGAGTQVTATLAARDAQTG